MQAREAGQRELLAAEQPGRHLCGGPGRVADVDHPRPLRTYPQRRLQWRSEKAVENHVHRPGGHQQPGRQLLDALFSVQLLTPALGNSSDDRALSGVVSGAVAVVIGLLFDAASRRRDAFWFYVGGYFAIGGGLIYYVINGYGSGGGSSGAWIALLVVGAAVLLGGAVLGAL